MRFSTRAIATLCACGFTVVLFGSIQAQQGAEWTARYDGPGHGRDKASAIALDDSGYIYVTGGSKGVGTETDIVTISLKPGSGVAIDDRLVRRGEIR